MRKKLRLLAAGMCISLLLPGRVMAAPEDVAKVNEIISNLPEREDLKEDDVETVEMAMELYTSLTTAEKIGVEDYEKLEKDYESFVESGLIRDEKREKEKERQRLKEEQESLKPSGENEPETTSYVFSISSNEPSLSVVMRYVTDKDGDGYGDMPDRIVLTSPSGETTSLSNANKNLKNDSMNIVLTWEKKFLQLDIAEAEEGNWKITSSEPATFSSMAYAGIRQEITASDEKTKEDAAEKPEESEEGETSPSGAWRFLLAAAVLVGLFFVFIRTRRKKNEIEEDDDEDDDEYDAPEQLTEEERVEQIRKDHQERLEKEKQREEEELRAEEEEEYNRQKDEAAKDSIAEYTEGDTDLLNKKENPVMNGGGLRTDGFFKKGRFD